jgi:hypothetical protein
MAGGRHVVAAHRYPGHTARSYSFERRGVQCVASSHAVTLRGTLRFRYWNRGIFVMARKSKETARRRTSVRRTSTSLEIGAATLEKHRSPDGNQLWDKPGNQFSSPVRTA